MLKITCESCGRSWIGRALRCRRCDVGEWLTTEEAADYLNISKRTIQRRAQEGRINKFNGEKSTYYKKDELDAL